MDKTKPYEISKHVVLEAFRRVKANRGAAGIDDESLESFEANLKNNLYKIWNRMSSGSYFPPPVKAVEIPKKNGGVRVLGVPTVADRVAQMVVKIHFEPKVEPYFHADSYGYWPGKTAADALTVTRKRCWKYDWVLELDIKGLFDNIDHGLLMKAVHTHTDNPWVLLYIERWLKAPFQMADGTVIERTTGTPQGGVISPVLANLFLHYAFDKWMGKNHPDKPFARYADDAVAHCRNMEGAQRLCNRLKERFAECGLELHLGKTRIVYCKDDDRRGEHPITKFDFLGYTFRPRRSKNRYGKYFINFTPAVSNKAKKAMRQTIHDWRMHLKPNKTLEDLSRMFNPVIRGWVNYYRLDNGSRMSREVQVRFCEGLGVRFPGATHLVVLARWIGPQVQKSVRTIVEELGLTLNESKTKTVDLSRGDSLEFLGYRLRLNSSNPREVRLQPSKKALQRLRNQVKGTVNRHRLPRGMDGLVRDVNPILRRWHQYFGLSTVRHVFGRIDYYVVTCFYNAYRKASQRPAKVFQPGTYSVLKKHGLYSLHVARPVKA